MAATRSLLAVLVVVACNDGAPSTVTLSAPVPRKAQPTPEAPAAAPVPRPDDEGVLPVEFRGRWRFELETPGGPLPFFAELDEHGGALVDTHERLPLSSATVVDGELRLSIDHYDSTITARMHAASRLVGTWRHGAPGRDAYTQMNLTATAGDAAPRFDVDPKRLQTLSGRWKLAFSPENRSPWAGLAELRSVPGPAGAPLIEGTILTELGDFRFLEGVMVDDQLRLATFDGAHAFVFHARRDGAKLVDGRFWVRDAYNSSFTGTPAQAGQDTGLTDPLDTIELTTPDGRFHFDFPALGGGTLAQDDPRLAGKPLVVEIFGTWCPNCNDQAPLMHQWYEQYAPRGLEMVGIAFEHSDDRDKSMDILQRYADRYDVQYPLLLGGTSDKARAGQRLPDLSKVVAYPTTLFIARDGTVQSVYSGFSGPATGDAFEALKAEFREQIEALL